MQISIPADSPAQIPTPCLQTVFFLALHTSTTLIPSSNILQHLKYLSLKYQIEKNYDPHVASEWTECPPAVTQEDSVLNQKVHPLSLRSQEDNV